MNPAAFTAGLSGVRPAQSRLIYQAANVTSSSLEKRLGRCGFLTGDLWGRLGSSGGVQEVSGAQVQMVPAPEVDLLV